MSGLANAFSRVNDLLTPDLHDYLDSMAEPGWELVSTWQFINEHSATTPQEKDEDAFRLQ